MVVIFHTALAETSFVTIATAVKKTVSRPPEPARLAEQMARAEGKTVSAVIKMHCVWRVPNISSEFCEIQGYWSRKIQEREVLCEEDLERYLLGIDRA